MKVKIGANVVNSNNTPIMIMFDKNEKQMISNMADDQNKYCSFPSESNIDNILFFMQDDVLCGCIHCCVEGIGIGINNLPELGIELHSGSKHLVAYGKDQCGWDISVMTPINFCPMCGRDLR